MVPIILLLLALNASAQTYSGSLTGVVTDPDSAVVPTASVVLIDSGKGYLFTATTDSTGRYLLRSLPPATYRLKVKAKGFAAYTRDGIVLNVNQNASVDVSLPLETVTETVVVQSESPLLATQDASLGQTIDRKFVNDLPLVGRNILNLTYLAPGVTPAAGRSYGPGGDVNFVSNGGRNSSAGVITDGVTTTGPDPNTGIVRALYVPSVDAVQEFKVEQNNFRADIGFSGNTSINIVTRSGTNQYHGTAYYFGQSSALNAMNFYSNKYGAAKPVTANNTFGGVLGGPVKKDRTFFFLVYNGGRSRNAQSTSAGVPSAAMRKGDFGELCTRGFSASGMCADANGQLWDPFSGVYQAARGGPVRSAHIPFNNLATYMSPGPPPGSGSPIQLPARPGNLIDPAAAKVMDLFPQPNVGVGTASYNRLRNYFANTSGRGAGSELNLRIDHRFSDKDMLVGKYAHNWGNSRPAKCFDSIMDPCSNGPGTSVTDHLALNFNRALSPATIATLNLGFARHHNISPGAPAEFPNFNPVSTLGLPDYVTRSGYLAAPYVAYGGGYVLGAIGTKTWSIWNMHFQNYQLAPSVDMVRGRHDLKAGGEIRVHRFHFFQPGVPTGTYTFNFNGTSQYPTTGGGDSLASFLTGAGIGGSYLVNAAISTQNLEYAFYFHDKWRVTDRLTLNLGLRYEITQPQTERFNRLNWFDPDVAAAIQAPGLPELRGGMRFGDETTRTPLETAWNNWGPRFGIAYRLGERTVLRAGYGMMYSVSMGNASGITGGVFSSWNQSTGVQTYGANAATPYSRFSDPFPGGGPLAFPGNSQGLKTALGLSMNAPPRAWKYIPNIQTWSAGFQRELPAAAVLSANYVGTKGTHLYFGSGPLNSLGSWVETLSAEEITRLFTLVPNPFYGVITNPQSSLRFATTQQSQLLKRYPQYTDAFTTIVPFGGSTYHALQVQVEKRLSRGLQVQAAYTWSKSIDDSSVVSGNTAYLGGGLSLQNPNNRRLERSLSQYDIPQSLKIAYTYDLPFGRYRQIGRGWNRMLDALAGGWTTTGMWIFQSGFPISLGLQGGQALPTYGAQRPDLLGPLKRNEGPDWRDRYFANPEVAVRPARYALGNAPRTLPVRVPGTNTATLALFKQVPLAELREGAKLEIRAEAFNALNRPQFAGPATTVGTPSFGLVSAQTNSARMIQLGMKLYF